jgi:N4-gp56 family major capsid protein
MGGGIQKIPKIAPCRIEGEDRYVQLLHPFQCHDLRTTTGATGWLEIQKSAAGAEGRNSPIFKGGLGMYNNVILHESQNVIQFNDYGAGANLTAARSLFMGRQALVVGFGSPGNGLRYEWIEETEDRGNKIVIVTGSILGFRKTGFVIDGVRRDMGVIANDTYISDPS